MDMPIMQVSRFRNVPEAVMRQIMESPEFRRQDFQEMLRRNQVRICFQGTDEGRGDIVTQGRVPARYVADGYLKAALVDLGLSGNAVIPQDETEGMFLGLWENDN